MNDVYNTVKLICDDPDYRNETWSNLLFKLLAVVTCFLFWEFMILALYFGGRKVDVKQHN